MFRSTVTLARRAALPVLVVLVSLAIPLVAFANQEPMEEPAGMQEHRIMLPSGEMVTIRMPSGASLEHPQYREVVGGYEIDYGGAFTRFEPESED